MDLSGCLGGGEVKVVTLGLSELWSNVDIYIYCIYKQYIYILVWPPPSNSDKIHYAFSREPLWTFIYHCYWEGATPKLYTYIYMYITHIDPGGFCCWERENPGKYSENLRLKFTSKRKENCKPSSRFTKYTKPQNHQQLIQITRSPFDHSKS